MAELVHQPQVELHSELCVVHAELQLIVAVRLGVHGRLGWEEVRADLNVIAQSTSCKKVRMTFLVACPTDKSPDRLNFAGW